jgi:dihydropteroate synthase
MTVLNHSTESTLFQMPQIMGILNVTPDSFSDGGKFIHFDNALEQVHRMIEQGASIIDIGGESTRPGAKEVSLEDELERVIPVLKAIKSNFNIKVSIDTSKANVMRQSIEHGADMINDVRALQNEGCIDAVKQSNVALCLMHMQGLPRTMQKNPVYQHLIEDIKTFFIERLTVCQQAGIDQNRIILDPGFGFGKDLTQNYQLLSHLDDFHCFNLPLLSGTSRKSMIGNLLNKPVEQRLSGSITTAIIAAQKGAQILRVHDVTETMDALKILQAVSNNS